MDSLFERSYKFRPLSPNLEETESERVTKSKVIFIVYYSILLSYIIILYY